RKKILDADTCGGGEPQVGNAGTKSPSGRTEQADPTDPCAHHRRHQRVHGYASAGDHEIVGGVHRARLVNTDAEEQEDVAQYDDCVDHEMASSCCSLALWLRLYVVGATTPGFGLFVIRRQPASISRRRTRRPLARTGSGPLRGSRS